MKTTILNLSLAISFGLALGALIGFGF